MNAERLLTLAAFLETLRPEQFDYNFWGKETKCGTVACALGWACHMPEFKVLGAGSRPFALDVGQGEFVMTLDGRDVPSWKLAEHLFGLSYDDHRYLFWPGPAGSGLPESASPRAVAGHIRSFVSRSGVPS